MSGAPHRTGRRGPQNQRVGLEAVILCQVRDHENLVGPDGVVAESDRLRCFAEVSTSLCSYEQLVAPEERDHRHVHLKCLAGGLADRLDLRRRGCAEKTRSLDRLDAPGLGSRTVRVAAPPRLQR